MSTNANVEPFLVKDRALVTIATDKKAHKVGRIISQGDRVKKFVTKG